MTATGSVPCDLSEGSWAVRLELVEGADLQIDAIAFHDVVRGRFAIEAEDYASYENTGGQMIQRVPVSGCSSGYILYGLDVPGEWTQYYAPVAEVGTYEVMITCRGGLNVNYGLRLVFTDVTYTDVATWGAIKSLYE